MISHDALLAAGFKESGQFFTRGKLSVFWCKEDNEYFLDHEYPFDFAVTEMSEIQAVDKVVNRPGLRHLEKLMAYGG